MQSNFDIIVVGAGSAGSVIASRLSDDPTRRVLLIEAGPPDDAPEIDMPQAWPTLMGTERDWAYSSTPQPALGGRPVALPRGRTIGGSSATNVMLYVRGDTSDYDDWGVPGWAGDDFAELFRRIETFGNADWPARGRSGPLKVTEHAALTTDASRFLQAAESLGHRRAADYNTGHLSGAAPFQSTIAGGRRQSAARAFLDPVRGRPNLTILTGCHVDRIVIRDGRATGLEARLGDRHMTFEAGDDIVLSAGAIGSPCLLMRSGIGPADTLRAAGIEVQSDLRAVGQNLSDHPLVPLGYRADCVPPPSHSGVEAVLFGRFDRTDRGRPDYQISFGSFLFFPPEMTDGATGCTLGVTICRPASRGSLRLDPANPAGAPLIDSGFLSDARDLLALENAVAEAESLAAKAGWPGLVTPSSAGREAFIRGTLGSNHHASGTCRMGSGLDGVVDPDLRVHGMEGLRIADASIMPQLVSGNPNATALAIGMNAADILMQATKQACAQSTRLETTP